MPRASGAEAAAGARSPRASEAAVMDPAAPGGQTAVGDPMPRGYGKRQPRVDGGWGGGPPRVRSGGSGWDEVPPRLRGGGHGPRRPRRADGGW